MGQRLPPLTPRAVIAALQRAGFFIHHASGSHYILKPPLTPHFESQVPFHRRDLKQPTLESILKQAGLSHEDSLRYL